MLKSIEVTSTAKLLIGMLQLYNIFVLDYFDLKASWVRGENVFRKGEVLKTLL